MNPEKIVLDSYAVIAYFENEVGAKKVEELLVGAESGKNLLLMSMVNWGEVYYALYRSKGEHKAEESILIMDQLPISLVNVDRSITYQAARLKARYSVALGDCFAAALAIANKSHVLTGDPEFKNLEGEISIGWLKPI
jgi:PIN domain nuclease of toxin-antitoxin system